MSTFTLRRLLLVASMLFCQVALADAAKSETKSDAKAPPPKSAEANGDASKQAELQIEPVVPPAPPFKLMAALKPVSMVEVDDVVEASDRAVQACNRNARRPDTLAVTVVMTIDGDGNVSAAMRRRRGQNSGKAPAEAACLVRVAKKLKFPATGTDVARRLPVHDRLARQAAHALLKRGRYAGAGPWLIDSWTKVARRPGASHDGVSSDEEKYCRQPPPSGASSASVFSRTIDVYCSSDSSRVLEFRITSTPVASAAST